MLEADNLTVDGDYLRRLRTCQPREYLRHDARTAHRSAPTVGFGIAAANNSSSRIVPGSIRNLPATSARTSAGTGSASPAAGAPASRRDEASSSAKNGLPPVERWIRSSSARLNVAPSRTLIN